jgi:hypothetical protein
MPSLGVGGGGDKTQSLFKGKGLWRRKENPIPTPEEISNNILGKRRRKR